ncbi:MAG TPA: acyl carrier protein [Burkholderiales bacterium]|jgi:acyl carrier protein|nr:acyl carrier protein [Burkholderiales bacterium]
MELENIESTVKSFIEVDFYDGVPQEIDRNISLLQTGVMDSMGLFRLIFFLQETYGVKIPDDELLAENFESLASISSYVARKLGKLNV